MMRGPRGPASASGLLTPAEDVGAEAVPETREEPEGPEQGRPEVAQAAVVASRPKPQLRLARTGT
jgi:hypothetical protein